jgi:hypothetical protein
MKQSARQPYVPHSISISHVWDPFSEVGAPEDLYGRIHFFLIIIIIIISSRHAN